MDFNSCSKLSLELQLVVYELRGVAAIVAFSANSAVLNVTQMSSKSPITIAILSTEL